MYSINKEKLDGIYKELVSNKPLFMGIAILLVVLYHCPRVHPALNAFNAFFIGVDFLVGTPSVFHMRNTLYQVFTREGFGVFIPCTPYLLSLKVY